MAPLLPLWGGRPAALCSAPLSSPAHPFQVHAFGRGRGAAPDAGCGLPPAGQPGAGGGWEGRPVSRPSRGVTRGPGGRGLVLPRSVPLPSLGGQHCGLHWRCSGHGGATLILLRFVVVRRPRAWPVRRSCALARVHPPATTPAGAGSGGRGGARRAGPAASPPGRHGPFWGRVTGSVPPWPAGRGGWGGEGWGVLAAVPFSSILGGARGPRACPPSSPVHPPLVYTGRWAVVGAGRGLVGRRWVSAGEGGREVSTLRPAPPPSPGGHQGGPPRLPIPGRHRADAAHGAGAEPPAGSKLCGSERAADRGRLARSCSRRGCGVPPWMQRPLRGAAGPPSLWPASGRPWAGGGVKGGGGVEGREGSRLFPPGLLAPPSTAAGGRPGGSGPGRPAADWGGVLFPRLPLALGRQTLAQALARVPCSPRRRRAVPAGRGGGEGRCVLGAVVRVSGQRLAGCGAVGLPSGPVPSSSLPLEVARAPPPHCTVGGGGGWGARLRRGGRPAALSPASPPRAHRLYGVGAGAAAVAGSVGGSPSG